jgi:hypothetical protein
MTTTTLEPETMEASLEAVMDTNGELSTPIIQEEQVRAGFDRFDEKV